MTIDDILQHYNLIPATPPDKTAFVTAEIGHIGETMVNCSVFYPTKPSVECQFDRSQIGLQWTSAATALLEIPAAWLTVFGLSGYEHEDEMLGFYKDRAAAHNAPYLPPTSDRPTERVGRIRI